MTIGIPKEVHDGEKRVATTPEVEHEPGIADDIPSETGGSNVTLTQKLLDFS